MRGQWLERRHTGSILPLVSPGRAALEALQALAGELRTNDVDGRRRYHVRARSIVRTYLEARFLVSAPNLTTEETLEKLIERDALSDDERLQLKSILLQTDAVKHARRVPTHPDCQNLYVLARG